MHFQINKTKAKQSKKKTMASSISTLSEFSIVIKSFSHLFDVCVRVCSIV